MRRRTPPLLAATVLGAVALRLALGHYDWRDVVAAAGLVGLTPLAEWAIFLYQLHAKPIHFRGRRRA